MATKYKEAQVSGNTWVRSNRVTIDNPMEGTPTIVFNEEMIYDIGGAIVRGPVSVLDKQLTIDNAFTEFQVLDTETNEEVGQVATYFQVRQLLHSLYVHLAKERDIEATRPYPSWIWNGSLQQWEPPIPMPVEGNWIWDESTKNWMEE
jgi:hypothetical protein